MRYNDRNEFRNSMEWKNFRQTMAESQDWKDYITGETLNDNWNLHHLDMNHDHYTDLSDTSHFVCLNKFTHKTIHELFLQDWKNMVLDEKEREVLERMEELNKDNIEPLLFSCNIEEYSFDTCKLVTESKAKMLGLSTDREGMIYWSPFTPGADRNQPVDSWKWLAYMKNKNKWNRQQCLIAMELRHLCLYSSLKNFQKPETKMKFRNEYTYNKTKSNCGRELKNTTLFLWKWNNK